MNKSAVFISYRRDDCTGYAGRLEDALEQALGHGAVFRDMRDIAAGESFADVIKSCLASARVVLVLIGPRWAGIAADGRKRIEDEKDFVRLEVATALESGCKVIPVLLSGVELPRKEELPEPLLPLRRRQALSLNEASWDADVARLIRALGLPTVRRRRLTIAAGTIALLAAGGVAAYLNKPAPPPPPVNPAVETATQLIGAWEGPVRYGWGDQYDERFVFERFAGDVTGTASFLKYPRGIEELQVDADHLSFITHSGQSMNGEERQLTHRYTAELAGDELRIRMHTTGGFVSYPPLEIVARRVKPSTP